MDVTVEMKEAANDQISSLRKEIDYDTRSYTIAFLVEQYRNNEFYIPNDYHRQFVWKEADKTRFIESILLGLPIPFMLFSDTDDGRCEIVDGSQRVQTLVEFMNNELILADLKKLSALNGFVYKDMSEFYCRKFNQTTMRIIVLSKKTSLDIRKELFDRMNATGVML